MADKPIKVDEHTDLLVAGLAHFLHLTKKAVVREAVAEFAEARRAVVGPTGIHLTFRELPIRRRIALRRSELIREFARHGGSDIRLMGGPAEHGEPDPPGSVPVELLVVTDIMEGSSAVATLEVIGSQLLAAPCRVVSATALRLFDPVGLERALAESRPL